MMNKRKYFRRTLFAIVLSSIVEIYFSYTWRAIPAQKLNASDAILYAFGGALLGKGIAFNFIIYYLFPILILCFFLTDYVQSDFTVSCVYIFTRSKSRCQWILKKISGLLWWVTGYYVFVLAAIMISYVCRGEEMPKALVAEVIMVMIFDILSTFMILLPMNLFAVRMGTVKSFLICFGGYAVLLLTGLYSPPVISKLLPFSQGNYAWHQPLWFAQAPMKSDCTIAGFSIIYSIVYMFIAILVEISFGVLFMKRIDLLSVPEGEN